MTTFHKIMLALFIVAAVVVALAWSHPTPKHADGSSRINDAPPGVADEYPSDPRGEDTRCSTPATPRRFDNYATGRPTAHETGTRNAPVAQQAVGRVALNSNAEGEGDALQLHGLQDAAGQPDVRGPSSKAGDSAVVSTLPGDVGHTYSGLRSGQSRAADSVGTRGHALRARVTAYCICSKCCGPNAKGITATGYRIQPGERIVAVDPAIIPLHSTVWLDGVAYRALDTGSAIRGAKIDVLVTGPDAHARARKLGVRTSPVTWTPPAVGQPE